jgi:hypothetical protein
LQATVDFPTPPLPEATAIIFFYIFDALRRPLRFMAYYI